MGRGVVSQYLERKLRHRNKVLLCETRERRQDITHVTQGQPGVNSTAPDRYASEAMLPPIG